MEWNKLIQERHTSFAWKEEVPSEEIILETLQEVYENIPSKNLMFPYQVRLLRNNDPIIQKEIFSICHRNADLDATNDPGNPQVLAPWLISFSPRSTKDLESRYEKTVKSSDEQIPDIEIGIFCAYMMLSLANKGIQTGNCRCIRNFDRLDEIFKVDNIRFIMGIGYAKDSKVRYNYFDPRVEKEKPIPFAPIDAEVIYPRPKFNDVIKVIKEN